MGEIFPRNIESIFMNSTHGALRYKHAFISNIHVDQLIIDFSFPYFHLFPTGVLVPARKTFIHGDVNI